jgi:hypothetical protein
MSSITWGAQRNLENSWYDFIKDIIDTQDLTVPNPTTGTSLPINITVGFPKSDECNLPVISAYVDGKNSPRLSIGSNCRQNAFLMIIDIRGIDIGSQIDLTEWLQDTINDGWTYFEYSPDGAEPIKVQKGHIAIDFLSNTPVRLGDDADLFDKYRQNISLSCNIQITS